MENGRMASIAAVEAIGSVGEVEDAKVELEVRASAEAKARKRLETAQ